MNLSRALLLFLIGLGGALPAQAAALSPARIDQIFAEYAKPSSPGCALAIYQNGKIAYQRSYGQANLELNIPITSRTVFDIGSTSKQFTAASIALLAEEGKLSLDDDVHKYLPELPDYGKTITIRHLLNHTSGLRDYLSLMDLAGIPSENWTTEDDAFAILVRQKELSFAPASRWAYSNSGFFLASQIVKRVSGKSLRQFAEERIFKPLGMQHTHYHDDHTELVPNRATAYGPRPGGGFGIEMSNFEQLGDGAVMTTVADLLLWDRNFYNNKLGKGRPDLIQKLAIPGKLADGNPIAYGLGLVPGSFKGLPTVSHGGAWAGYRAELMRFPTEKLSIACLCNLSSTDPTELAQKVAAVALADRLKPEAPKAAGFAGEAGALANLFKNLAGTYRNTETGAPWTIEYKQVKSPSGTVPTPAFALTLKTPSRTSALLPLKANTFSAGDLPGQITLRFETHSGTTRILRFDNGQPAGIYEPYTPYTPAASELALYAGEYYSPEVGASAWIEPQQEGLSVTFARKANTHLLKPTSQDSFFWPGGAISFERSGERPATFILQLRDGTRLRYTRK